METIPPMSTNQPEINELVRIYAKEKGISESAAWGALTKVWIPKAQIYDIYGLPSQPQLQLQQPNVTAELMAGKQNVSIQKLELDFKVRQLEYQEKTEARAREAQERLEAREAQKLELEKEKIKNDKEIALTKLELDKTIADRKSEQESRRIESKEDFDAKLLLIQAGKKPEDAIEKFYERLFEEKKSQDEHIEKLRKEHSDQLQKLENSIKNKSSPEDIFEQLEKLKKVEKGMMETTLTSLEAYGVDTKVLRKAAKIDEKKSEDAIDGVYKVGKKLWEDYIVPNIDKAQRELSPPPQGGQSPTPEQVERQRRFEADQQEQLRIETLRKQEENERLHTQVEQEREIRAQRQHLEDRAVELGIAVNPSMTDRQISDLIVRQEFILDKGRAQREKLDAHAIRIGITPNPALTNEEIFDMIEHREAEIEQYHKSETEQYEMMKKEQEIRGQQEERTSPAVQPVIILKEETSTQEPQQKQADIKEKRLTVNTIAKGLHIDIKEELIKLPETSKETEEFLSGRGKQAAEHRDTVVQVAENINEVAPQEASEVHFDEMVKPLDKDAPKKKGRKKQDRQDQQEKQPNIYQVVREDGELIGDVEAKNPHGAAMKAARITGATDESPATIKISGGGLEKEQTFRVAMAEVMNRGKKTQVAKAERLKV
jgi:hypothetical protein